MKNLSKILFLCGIIIFTTFSCDEENNKNESDQIIELGFNDVENVRINDFDYQIQFIDVQDERCFTEDCYLCYGSLANVTIKVGKNDEQATEIKLEILGCLSSDALFNNDQYNVLVNDSFKLRLGELSPYPKNQEHFGSIIKQDYRIKLIVLKNY